MSDRDRGATGTKNLNGGDLGAFAGAAKPFAGAAKPCTDAATRALDLLIALPAALASAPVVLVACAAIRFETPGDPIYRQTRVGRHGRPFTIYKLRTMVSGAEHVGAGLAIQEGDDRITRVGLFLRRFSLDELPNLWNVIAGEMSIVGPRPTLAHQVAQYTDEERHRLDVKPGITGWAQVNGRATLPWTERIQLDLWYVEHRSVRLNLKILALTLVHVLRGEGIYRGERGGWHPRNEQGGRSDPDV